MSHFTEQEAAEIFAKLSGDNFTDLGVCNAAADAAIEKLADKAGMPPFTGAYLSQDDPDVTAMYFASDVHAALAAMRAKVDSLESKKRQLATERHALRVQLEKAQTENVRLRGALTTIKESTKCEYSWGLAHEALKEHEI